MDGAPLLKKILPTSKSWDILIENIKMEIYIMGKVTIKDLKGRVYTFFQVFPLIKSHTFTREDFKTENIMDLVSYAR